MPTSLSSLLFGSLSRSFAKVWRLAVNCADLYPKSFIEHVIPFNLTHKVDRDTIFELAFPFSGERSPHEGVQPKST